MTPPASELEARVRAAAEGTPYAVTSVPGGFDVTLELADAQWWGLFNRAGLQRSFVHEVRLDEPSGFAITDVERRLDWVAGSPRVAASASVKRGRIIALRAEKVWALGDDGRISPVVDYRFDSSEGRQLVETAAAALGLQQRRGTEERVGLVFAVIGGVGAVVTVVVLLVLLLLGKF